MSTTRKLLPLETVERERVTFAESAAKNSWLNFISTSMPTFTSENSNLETSDEQKFSQGLAMGRAFLKRYFLSPEKIIRRFSYSSERWRCASYFRPSLIRRGSLSAQAACLRSSRLSLRHGGCLFSVVPHAMWHRMILFGRNSGRSLSQDV